MKKFFLVITLSVIFFSCSTTGKIITDNLDSTNQSYSTEKKSICTFDSISDLDIKWNFNNSYFSSSDFYLKKENALCHAVKIDLSDPDLLITLIPDEQKVSLLAKKYDIVINTIPWSQKIPLISKKIPVGILCADGIEYSPSNPKYDSISFSSARSEITVGGFWKIIERGNPSEKHFKEITDSRTSLAVSKDAKTLYILIVEGEHKKKSKGLSYRQCAQIFLKFDAYEAIELDGGSSTTLYIHGKNVLSYKKNPKLPAFLCFSKVLFDK